jgi:galactose mutarotase-like enzyme
MHTVAVSPIVSPSTIGTPSNTTKEITSKPVTTDNTSALHKDSPLSPIQHVNSINFDTVVNINSNPLPNGMQISQKEIDTQNHETGIIHLTTIKLPKTNQLISFSNLGANVLDLRLGGTADTDMITSSPLLTNPKLDTIGLSHIRGLNPICSPPGRIEDEIVYPVNESGLLDNNGADKVTEGKRISESAIDKFYPRNQQVKIHGLLFKKKWALEQIKTNSNNDLQISFIFDTRKDKDYSDFFGEMIYKVTYTLTQRNTKPEFLTEMSVENVSKQSWLGKLFGKKAKDAFPIGLQSHPYFLATDWRFNGSSYMELDNQNFPTGKILELNDKHDLRRMQAINKTSIDHPYYDLRPESDYLMAEFIRPDKKVLQMRWDPKLAPFGVVYNLKSKEGQVCIEPSTSAPNASQLQFNPNCNIAPNPIYLKPGEKKSMWWSINLQPNQGKA